MAISGRWVNGGPRARQGVPGSDPVNMPLLEQSADAADAAALAEREAEDERERSEGRISGINHSAMLRHNQLLSKLMNPQWRLWFQNLRNLGVDELKTAAAAGAKQGGGIDVLHEGEGDEFSARQIGGANLGFFDTQRPSIAGLREAVMPSIQQQKNKLYIDAQDTNRHAADYQKGRR